MSLLWGSWFEHCTVCYVFFDVKSCMTMRFFFLSRSINMTILRHDIAISMWYTLWWINWLTFSICCCRDHAPGRDGIIPKRQKLEPTQREIEVCISRKMTCTKSSMSLVLYFYGQDLPETGPDGLDPRLSIFHCSTSIYICMWLLFWSRLEVWSEYMILKCSLNVLDLCNLKSVGCIL